MKVEWLDKHCDKDGRIDGNVVSPSGHLNWLSYAPGDEFVWEDAPPLPNGKYAVPVHASIVRELSGEADLIRRLRSEADQLGGKRYGVPLLLIEAAEMMERFRRMMDGVEKAA